MDGRQPQMDRAEVERRVAEIRAHMPETYRSIQAKADKMGRLAYALVRQGIAGQPDRFWACERGRVVGTPFSVGGIQADVAATMVQFNCRSVVIWGRQTEGGDGAH